MTQVVEAQVCVVGGGPAGMVHALLLARAGIRVVVLEKHSDFLRDFRGDTVHPTTLRIMDELGLIDEFLRLPHTKVNRVTFDTAGSIRTFGNFSAPKRLGFRQPYIALKPQWDFLDFLAEKASAYPEFTLIRNAEAIDLIFDGDRVVGVSTPELEVRAELVVGADRRKSAVRVAAGLEIATANSPMDVLWFRLKWRPGIADGASKSTIGQASSVAASTTASGRDVPETLSAAAAAAQANVDRFSSGDFAGVWQRMSREVRDGITQEDFVTFYETCKTAGPKIRVAGVRLDAAHGEAIVRMEVGGTKRPRIMLFENGNWVMKPTPGFAAHLGEPVEQIVAEEKSAGLCSN